MIARLGRVARGQSLVEFALTLPVFLLLVLVGLDIGRAFHAQVTLNNAARVGARYAAAHADSPSWTGTYQSLISNEWAGMNCAPGAIPDPEFPEGTGVGRPAVVTLSCTFSIITPIIGNIVGNSLTIAGSATMPITLGDFACASDGTATPAPGCVPPQPTPIGTPAPCVEASPLMSANPTAQSGLAGETLSYTITVSNRDSSTCSAKMFDLTTNVSGNSSGWARSVSPSSMTLGPGTSGSATLSVTSPLGAPVQDKTISVSTTGASVDVVYRVRTCSTAPALSAAPTTQSGLAGQTLTYSITVTSLDPASCPDRTYNISSPTNITGWTISLSPTSVTLVAGASGTATLSVTSASSASTGNQSITVSSSGASTSVTYAVVTCTFNPTVAVIPSSQTLLPGQAAQYTVTVTNNDISACAARNFSLTAVLTGNANQNQGWSAVLNPTTLNIAPGTSATSTLTVTSPTTARPQSKTVTVTATGTGGGSGQATATYVVADCAVNPQLRADPTSRMDFPNTDRTYSITITNRDASVCPPRDFTMTATVEGSPPGWTFSFNPTPITIAGGTSGTTVFTVRGPDTRDITIQATSTNTWGTVSGTVTVRYETPNCTADPRLTAVPPSKLVLAGTATAYTVTVTNDDTTGNFCPARDFNLSAAVAGGSSGWTLTLEPASFNLAAGQSGTSTLTVSGPSNGTIDITATGVGGGTASAQVQYVVLVCDRNPGVSAAPTSRTTLAGQSVTYTVTVTNNDEVGCPSRNFDLTAAAPSGFSADLAPGSLSLPGGSSLDATLTVSGPQDGTVTVTATGVGGGTGSVQVQYVTFVCNRTPSISAQPTTRTAEAGTTVTYSLAVTNNDDNGCPSRDFALSADAPSGWTATVDLATLSLAGGNSSNATLTVTSAAAAAEGTTHNITVTASSAASSSASTTVTYSIPGTCTTANPTVTISPALAEGPAGSALVYDIGVTNNDTGSACTSRAFTLSISGLPGDWTFQFDSSATITLNPGEIGGRTLTITSAATAPAGDTPFTVSATGNGTSGSVDGTYRVQ